MTAQAIANRLTESAKGVTPERVQKAQAAAMRARVAWADVVACLPEDVRATL